jgi:hypothetical protein
MAVPGVSTATVRRENCAICGKTETLAGTRSARDRPGHADPQTYPGRFPKSQERVMREHAPTSAQAGAW